MTGGIEGAGEEGGRVDGGRVLARLEAGDPCVVPGLGAVVGGGVVERQQRGPVGEVSGGRLLDELGGQRVQLTAAPEREARVGDLAHDRLAPLELAGGQRRDDEPVQPLDGLVELDVGQPADGAQVVAGEAGAEHRGAPQQLPVVRVEHVDAGRQHPLDRVGQLVDVATGHRGGAQLLEEQRVAAAEVDEGGPHVRGERAAGPIGHVRHQRVPGGLVDAGELEQRRVVPIGGAEARCRRSGG